METSRKNVMKRHRQNPLMVSEEDRTIETPSPAGKRRVTAGVVPDIANGRMGRITTMASIASPEGDFPVIIIGVEYDLRPDVRQAKTRPGITTGPGSAR